MNPTTSSPAGGGGGGGRGVGSGAVYIDLEGIVDDDEVRPLEPQSQPQMQHQLTISSGHKRHYSASRTRSAPGSAGEGGGRRRGGGRGSGDSNWLTSGLGGLIGGSGGDGPHPHYNYMPGIPDQTSFLSTELRARLICDGTLPFTSWVTSRGRGESTVSGSGSFWGKN